MMTIKEILENYNEIAVVGFSNNPARPSNRIAKYLLKKKYKVYGVNPNLNCETVDTISCYNSLKDIPLEIQIVNIFRRSEFVYDLVKEVLSLNYKPQVIWTQIGVVDKNAKKLAESNGLTYIENECIMIEHQNLLD